MPKPSEKPIVISDIKAAEKAMEVFSTETRAIEGLLSQMNS